MDERDHRITSGITGRARSRRQVIRAIVGIGLAMIVLFLPLHAVNKLLLGDSEVLALDRDYSVQALWNVLLFAVAAAAWWRLGLARPDHRWVWTAMAVLCGALAVEAIVQVHKDLERSLGFEASILVVQPLLAAAVVGLFVMCVRRLPSPERLLVAAAAVTLVLAQLFSVVNGQFDLPYAGIVAVQTLEEVMEILTATLLLAAPAGLALGLPWRSPEVGAGAVPVRSPVPSA